MATHLAESQEADRYLVPPLEIEGGYWQSTTDQALTQQSLPPPSSCGDGNFSFSPIDGSANQSWGTSSINPNGSSSFSIYSSDSDALVPLPSLPVSSFIDNSLNCSSEQGFPSSSVAAQGAKSLSVGAGLANMGNTCFINAILQCLTHTAPFVEGLRSVTHDMPCNSEDLCVLCAIRDHIELSLTSMGGIISPLQLVDNLNYFSSCFRRYQQEDAHEFLQCFLDKLERCLVREAKDQISFEDDDDLVNNVFGGRLISNLCCCNCGHCSETHEPLVDLSLEIENVDSLSSALESFTRVEKIGDPETKFKCENCKEEVLVEKQLKLEKIPLVTTFHLKRFKADSSFVEKIEKHLEFPLELDLQPYSVRGRDAEVELKYELYAIVEHTGFSSTSGHYFSFVRSSPDTWHRMDDSMVTPVSEDYVLSREAYILLYKRKGTSWFSSLIQQRDPCLNSCSDTLQSIDTVRSSLSAESIVNCETTNVPVDTLRLSPAQFSVAMGEQDTGANDLGNPTSANLHIFESAALESSPIVSKNLCSNGNDEGIDGFRPLSPTRSPSPDIVFQTPEPQYQIPVSHLKTEKCSTSGRPSNKGVEDPERKAALRYIKKSMPGSRGLKMINAILGPQNEGPLNKKKRLRSLPCKRSSPPNNRRKTSIVL
ncbi:ubiquitin carboxyl-terminal hydrolase 20-like isoform X1 [Cucurbita moschata]|uniref:Ubiquitin carboxyl-terminal hydrolase n=1 Tax=Cucurbita moschata TaxID=3662 RepID=A0A6J1E9J0_CUCMO|nr:ubiquitin carboxyl-terminal hydrolase 20-like isoform X1 [Cucurbita moschata]